jgi:hypothetical protein
MSNCHQSSRGPTNKQSPNNILSRPNLRAAGYFSIRDRQVWLMKARTVYNLLNVGEPELFHCFPPNHLGQYVSLCVEPSRKSDIVSQKCSRLESWPTSQKYDLRGNFAIHEEAPVRLCSMSQHCVHISRCASLHWSAGCSVEEFSSHTQETLRVA